MDEAFSVFIEEVGQPMHRQEVPTSTIERYKGKLPDRLLQYWSEHGWCGYGDGIFWIVNPQDYDWVLPSWLDGTVLEKLDTFHVIARSAFGDIFLWGESTGRSLTIDCNLAKYTYNPRDVTIYNETTSVEGFFLTMRTEYLDFENLFAPARKKLGTLGPTEVYGFVPALTLGGPCKLSNLEKIKTVEHLMLLSQISSLEPYSFSDFKPHQ